MGWKRLYPEVKQRFNKKTVPEEHQHRSFYREPRTNYRPTCQNRWTEGTEPEVLVLNQSQPISKFLYTKFRIFIPHINMISFCYGFPSTFHGNSQALHISSSQDFLQQKWSRGGGKTALFSSLLPHSPLLLLAPLHENLRLWKHLW